MKNNSLNPIDKARELSISICNSVEYNAMKKAEEAVLNDKLAIELLNKIDELREQNRNPLSCHFSNEDFKKTDTIEEIQEKIDRNIVIQSYYTAQEEYQKLLKNINNIIEFMTGEFQLINNSRGCCRNSHSNCSHCVK